MALMTFTASDVNSGAAYTLTHNPASIQRPHKQKRVESVNTYTSHATFNWGFASVESGIIGERVILSWPAMKVSPDWNRLVEYYQTSQVVTWDAQEKAHNGTSNYTVVVVRLDGNDYETNTLYRKDVEMELEIRAVT